MAGQFRLEGLQARRERQGLALEVVARRAEVSEELLTAVEAGGACLLRDALAIARVLKDDTEDRAKLKGVAGRLGLQVVEA
jgi:hypothetical protein